MLTPKLLGGTDLLISPLSLGTVKFGRTEGVHYPEQFILPSDQVIADLIYLARDVGINCLDTAPAYGASEERLGQFFKKNNVRQQFILATKAGEQFQNGESQFNFSKDAIVRSIDLSLKKLNTDYLDILLIHSHGKDLELLNSEVLNTLFAMKKQGKIRFFGMSSKTVEGGIASLEWCDLAMVTLNMQYTEELPVIEKAYEEKKGILIKKAFGSGHLFKTIALKEQLKFIFEIKGISSIVIGTINFDHLRESAQATEEILKYI